VSQREVSDRAKAFLSAPYSRPLAKLPGAGCMTGIQRVSRQSENCTEIGHGQPEEPNRYRRHMIAQQAADHQTDADAGAPR
jgi:hypothetical protein